MLLLGLFCLLACTQIIPLFPSSFSCADTTKELSICSPFRPRNTLIQVRYCEMFNDEVTFDLPKNLSYLAVSNPTTRAEGGGGGESSSPSFVGNASLKKSAGSKAVNNEGKITASRHSLVRRNTRPEQLSPRRHSESSKQNRSSGILKCKSQQESLKVLYKSAGSMYRSFSSVGKMNTGSSNVSFDTVQIREYPRCVGDNPSVKAGPPMR